MQASLHLNEFHYSIKLISSIHIIPIPTYIQLYIPMHTLLRSHRRFSLNRLHLHTSIIQFSLISFIHTFNNCILSYIFHRSHLFNKPFDATLPCHFYSTIKSITNQFNKNISRNDILLLYEPLPFPLYVHLYILTK